MDLKTVVRGSEWKSTLSQFNSTKSMVVNGLLPKTSHVSRSNSLRSSSPTRLKRECLQKQKSQQSSSITVPQLPQPQLQHYQQQQSGQSQQLPGKHYQYYNSHTLKKDINANRFVFTHLYSACFTLKLILSSLKCKNVEFINRLNKVGKLIIYFRNSRKSETNLYITRSLIC